MSNLPAVSSPKSILDPQFIENLETYEDYLSYYQQLEEASTAFSWIKAETLRAMENKLGENSIRVIAKDLGYPASTIANYIRVARAFPPEKRDPVASFSAHFQASFADKFNHKRKEFDGESRFKWIQEAADANLSTRQLADKIQAHRLEQGGISKISADMVVDATTKVQNITFKLQNLLHDVEIDQDRAAYEKILFIYKEIYGNNKGTERIEKQSRRGSWGRETNPFLK